MDFEPLCLCVGVVQKGTVQIYVKPVTGSSTTLMKEVIILHCRVVYQSNVLPGQWAWLGMQSFSDYEFCGVVVRGGGWGGGRGEGKTKSPQVKKKGETFLSHRFLPLPSFSLTNGFHFVVHLFNKTLQMLQVRKGSTRCAAFSYPLLKENRSLFLLWIIWHWACHVDVINGLQ